MKTKEYNSKSVVPTYNHSEEEEVVKDLLRLRERGWTGDYYPIPRVFRLRPPGYGVHSSTCTDVYKKARRSPWSTKGGYGGMPLDIYPLAAVIYSRTGIIVPRDDLWPGHSACKEAGISHDTALRVILASDFNEKKTINLRMTMLAFFDCLPLWAEFIDFDFNFPEKEAMAA